jgi:hypothetical protein
MNEQTLNRYQLSFYASLSLVQFSSVKSLQFLTAVHSKIVPRVKPTTNAPLIAEKNLRKMVVEV